jgi:hypothetical protein
MREGPADRIEAPTREPLNISRALFSIQRSAVEPIVDKRGFAIV